MNPESMPAPAPECTTRVVSDENKADTALLLALTACAQGAESRSTSPADRLVYAQAADTLASAIRTYRESFA